MPASSTTSRRRGRGGSSSRLGTVGNRNGGVPDEISVLTTRQQSTVQKQILETARLLLREMSLDDLDFVAAMLAHPEAMRFYPKCYTRDEAAAWVQRQIDRYARHGHGLWLVSDTATGQPVGQVGLVMQTVRAVEEREVGYLVHRPF